MNFADVLGVRHSCRRFLGDTVPRAEQEELLRLAQSSPSWCNTQPWQVHVVTGTAIEALGAKLTECAMTSGTSPDLPMPTRYAGVYAERRRDAGYALYGSLGIGSADYEARTRQGLLNYSFFGAPHVAIITTERDMGVYGAVDCGAYIAFFTLAAASMGIATVTQAAIAMHSTAVREFLDLSDDRLVVCGVAFGYADPEDPVNAFRTGRAGLDEVVHWVDGSSS